MNEDLVPQTSTLGKGVAKGTDTQSAKSADRQTKEKHCNAKLIRSFVTQIN
ncbi:MAG: hypothetical protein R2778_16055 [Saprospiraceae bacterium]